MKGTTLPVLSGTRLLFPGNEKLGPDIWTFSLPPVHTCGQATPACVRHCYAIRYLKRFPRVQDSYHTNYRIAATARFTTMIQDEIDAFHVRTLRIHVAGDFFDAAYVRRWIEIARSRPHTLFFSYTRSWRDPEMRPLLDQLGSLQNVRLWYSFDQDSPDPDPPPYIRTAYMSTDDVADRPPIRADLVFRTSGHREGHLRKRIRLNTVLVCPVENGTSAGHEMTCGTCRICFDVAWDRDRL